MSEPQAYVPLDAAWTNEAGARCYRWADTAEVTCTLHKVSRGRYPVTVTFQGTAVTQGTVDMLNLADRERVQAHCRHLDGQVNWLQRFVVVAQDLSALDGPRRTIETIQLSSVTPARVDCWWKPYIPKGRAVALDGDPGAGKSTLVVKIMAHLTSGTAFPNLYDYAPSPASFAPQTVCLFTAEDDPADTILPRVLVNGGDPSRVHLIPGWTQTDGTRGVVTMQDIDLLRQALDTHQPGVAGL